VLFGPTPDLFHVRECAFVREKRKGRGWPARAQGRRGSLEQSPRYAVYVSLTVVLLVRVREPDRGSTVFPIFAEIVYPVTGPTVYA